MSEEPWIAMLRRAVEHTGSIKAVADQLDISRTTVSLILSGKYPAKPGNIEKAVHERLSVVACPHLGAEISGRACIDHQNRPPPPVNGEGWWHYRACRACRRGVGRLVREAAR